MENIIYAIENDLTVEEFREILETSSLGERRPIDDLSRLENMLRHANLIVTARLDGRLIGVSRSLTDFSFALTFLIWPFTRTTRKKESAGS